MAEEAKIRGQAVGADMVEARGLRKVIKRLEYMRKNTQTSMFSRTHARAHARKRTRTHTRTHAHTNEITCVYTSNHWRARAGTWM